MAVAHFSLNLSFRNQCGDRVDDNNVQRAAAHQHITNLQCLFSGIRLRNQKTADIDTQILRVNRIQRVFRVDEGRLASCLLCFGDDMQRQRCLTGRFRSVNLYNSAFWHAADAGRDIQTDGTAGNRVDIHLRAFITELHNGTLAELLLDLCHRSFQCFIFLCFICIYTHSLSLRNQ